MRTSTDGVVCAVQGVSQALSRADEESLIRVPCADNGNSAAML